MRAALFVVLAIQAVAFVAFTICAFRWLFALRRDAVAMSGSTFPGLSATLGAFRDGLREPRYARMRWGIIGSVLVLIGTGFLVPSLMQA